MNIEKPYCGLCQKHGHHWRDCTRGVWRKLYEAAVKKFGTRKETK